MGAVPDPLVYLLDDDPTWLRALARSLRAEGLEVQTFDDPERALTRLSPPPDLFVIDYDLGPAGTGSEFAVRLRGELRGSCPPLVLLSGTVSDLPDRELVVFDAAFSKDTPTRTLMDALVRRVHEHSNCRSGRQRRGDASGNGERPEDDRASG